jgi:hypothetical protein
VVIRFFNKELDSSRPDGEQGAGSNAAAAGTAHGGDAWSVKQVLERVTAISQVRRLRRVVGQGAVGAWLRQVRCPAPD